MMARLLFVLSCLMIVVRCMCSVAFVVCGVRLALFVVCRLIVRCLSFVVSCWSMGCLLLLRSVICCCCLLLFVVMCMGVDCCYLLCTVCS